MRLWIGLAVIGVAVAGGAGAILDAMARAAAEAQAAAAATETAMFFGPSEETLCSKYGAPYAGEASRDLVAKKVPYPDTATHPHPRYLEKRVDYLGDCEFRVSSYVISNNGRGARIQAPYVMVVIYSRTAKDWHERSLRFAVNPHGPSYDEQRRAQQDRPRYERLRQYH